MSVLDELIDIAGDDAKKLIKTNLLELIEEAKSETETLAKETGEKIEEWLILKVSGEIDSDELEALLNARRRTVEQFLNSQEISARARLEKVTIGLIDLILDNALDSIL